MIDLGKSNLLDIHRHTMSRIFNTKTTRPQDDQCTDGFKVSSPFCTEKTLVEEDKALLTGNSLKPRIPDKNALLHTSNKYAECTNFTSGMLIYEKAYMVELSSTFGTPVTMGPFDTVTLLKINYS